MEKESGLAEVGGFKWIILNIVINTWSLVFLLFLWESEWLLTHFYSKKKIPRDMKHQLLVWCIRIWLAFLLFYYKIDGPCHYFILNTCELARKHADITITKSGGWKSKYFGHLFWQMFRILFGNISQHSTVYQISVDTARTFNSELLIHCMLRNGMRPLWFPGKVIYICRPVKQEIVIAGNTFYRWFS